MGNRFILIDVASSIADFILNSLLTIYLLKMGLSFTEISLLWAFYMATSALTDYPTGGLADRFGRRKIHAIGMFLSGLAYLLLASTSQFYWLVWVSYFIKGISASQISGSLTAWLNAAVDASDKFTHILKSSQNISTLLNVGLGIGLYFLNPDMRIIRYLIIVCGCFNLLIGGLTLKLLPENYGQETQLKKIYTAGFQLLKKNVWIQNITLISGLTYILTSAYMLVWQPILYGITASTKWNSLLSSLFAVFIILGLKLFQPKLETNILGFIGLQLGVYFFFGLAFSQQSLGLFFLAMALQGISLGFRNLLVSTGIKKYSDSSEIATITSLISSLSMAVGLIFQVIFGMMIDKFGLSILLSSIMGLLIVSLVIFRRRFKRNDRRS